MDSPKPLVGAGIIGENMVCCSLHEITEKVCEIHEKYQLNHREQKRQHLTLCNLAPQAMMMHTS